MTETLVNQSFNPFSSSNSSSLPLPQQPSIQSLNQKSSSNSTLPNPPTPNPTPSSYSTNLSSKPFSQQSSPIVSCVFCIDASLKSQLNWKTFGSDYLSSYLRAIQTLYTNATYRLTPIFFTSLPPSVPAHQSVTQPYPFLGLDQFSVIIPDLLPLKHRSNPTNSDFDDAFDYGGDDPAILDAIIRALELLDRKPVSNSPQIRYRPQPQHRPQPTHHKHILIITSTDIGPPGMLFNPNKPICFDPSVEELPRTVPMLNQKAEYDGVTFQDLTGRFIKDPQGKWNFNDKQVGLLEKKSIVLGLIAAARTPRLLSFIGRHLGPFVLYAARQQNVIRLLHKSHSVVISGFTDIHPPTNKRPAATLSNTAPTAPNSSNVPLSASAVSSKDASGKVPQLDADLQPQVKRPRIQSNDSTVPTAPPINPFSILDPNATKAAVSSTGPALALPVIIQPHEQPSTSSDHQRASSFLSSSKALTSASDQLDQPPNKTDNSLAQGLSFLIGGHKTAAAPQANASPANSSHTNLPAGLGPGRSQQVSAVTAPMQTPPNDALSQALALLGGVSGIGGGSAPLPVSNLSAPSNGPQNLLPTSQAQSTSVHKPSPREHQSTPYAQQSQNQISTPPVHPIAGQKSQHIFQPQQMQLKQQHQLQQLQQLQECQKIQHQHIASQRPLSHPGVPNHLSTSQPESFSPSNSIPRSHPQVSAPMTSQASHNLLPAASVVPTPPQTQQTQHLLPQQNNPNPNRLPTNVSRQIMESAQAKAREQLRIIEAKFKRGEINEEDAKYVTGKIKAAITEALRNYAVNAAKAKSQASSSETVMPSVNSTLLPNLSPPSLSDAPIAWRGRLVWSITIPGSGNGHEAQKKELSIPIGAVPYSSANDWRSFVDSWPKVWRVEGMRQTNMVDLSQRSGFEKPMGVALHLLNEPASASNGGISNEDIYTKFCEHLGVNLTSVVPFDDAGHGAVLLYNRAVRLLFAIIFQKTVIPYNLFQGPAASSSVPTNSTSSMARPNSSASTRPGGIGSPNMLNQLQSGSLPSQTSNLAALNSKQQFIQQVLAQQHRNQILSQQPPQHPSQVSQPPPSSLNPHNQQLLHNLSASFNPTNVNHVNSTNHLGHLGSSPWQQ